MDDSTLVPVPASEPAPVEQTIFEQGDDICVVARYPYQMQACQTSLAEWATRKITELSTEVDDLAENVEIARKSKWGTSALIRARNKAMKRREFYEKIKAALDAGHCIVPNFPVDMIAIRTRRALPDRREDTNRYDNKEQPSESLPIGDGAFQNPLPTVYQKTVADKSSETPKLTTTFWAEAWQDFDFPFRTAKPQILSATARAMADKVFDEIGVLPGRRPKGDPIIVGRIIDKTGGKDAHKVVSFLIAWFIDTKDL